MSFADVPLLLVKYLKPIMGDVDVATRVPPRRPAEFLQIRRSGGVPPGVVREAARIDVRAWAETEPRAYEIASTARTAMWQLAGTNLLGAMCYEVSEFMGPNMIDDDKTGTPISWFTHQLVIRADDIIHIAPSVSA